MGTDQIMYCIVALILGMLMYHMLKGVCGCKTVEGAVTTSSYGDACSTIDDPAENQTCLNNRQLANDAQDAAMADTNTTTKFTRAGTFLDRVTQGSPFSKTGRTPPCLDYGKSEKLDGLGPGCTPGGTGGTDGRAACHLYDRYDTRHWSLYTPEGCTGSALDWIQECTCTDEQFSGYQDDKRAKNTSSQLDSKYMNRFQINSSGTTEAIELTQDSDRLPAVGAGNKPSDSDDENDCRKFEAKTNTGFAPVLDSWCKTNCAAPNPNCPELFCTCTSDHDTSDHDTCTKDCPPYTAPYTDNTENPQE